MKLLLLYINILVCFSALLDEVRKEVVDKALLKLPKRGSIDILKMALEMSNAKEEFKMTDIESAYFAYKWIGQNIELDCLGKKFGNATTIPTNTYKNGKGGEVGISELFNMICGFLDIETNIILGIKKDWSEDYNSSKLFKYDEYAWNYMSIDNEYYLLDLTSGAGLCTYSDEFLRRQKDDYFGINPELSIRRLFPNDKEWQLLSKPITEEQFKSQSILDVGFFKYFSKFSPDVSTIKGQTKVTLTFKDPKIEKLYIRDCFSIEKGYTLVPEWKEVKIINGSCDITIRPSEKRNGYAFIQVSEDTKNYYTVVTYGVLLS